MYEACFDTLSSAFKDFDGFKVWPSLAGETVGPQLAIVEERVRPKRTAGSSTTAQGGTEAPKTEMPTALSLGLIPKVKYLASGLPLAVGAGATLGLTLKPRPRTHSMRKEAQMYSMSCTQRMAT